MATTIDARRIVPDTEPSDCQHCGAESTPSRPVFFTDPEDGTTLERMCRPCLDDLDLQYGITEDVWATPYAKGVAYTRLRALGGA